MARLVPFILAVANLACLVPGPQELAKWGRLEGHLDLSPQSQGDAYLFLYPRLSGRAPEGTPPTYVTAVSSDRLVAADTHFVFGSVAPNPYRLSGFLDVDRNFQPEIDVLAQPGAGDRVFEPIDLNLQPGQVLTQDVAIKIPQGREPPAFQLDPAPAVPEIELPDQPATLITFELVLQPLGTTLRPDRHAFVVSLADADRDGQPDNDNQDGIPELFPQIFLRFLPKPGQEVPADRAGNPATVLIPMQFNPGPFLANLSNDPQVEIAVDRLQIAMIPQAQAVTFEPGRGRVVSAMTAIPVGSYELLLLHESGQYWRIPNGLATEAATKLGGPFPDQGVRFRVVHGNGLDAGQ